MRVLLLVALAAVALAQKGTPPPPGKYDGDKQGRFVRGAGANDDVKVNATTGAVETWCDRRIHTSCYVGCEECVGETLGKCSNYWPTQSNSGCLKCKTGYFNSSTPLLTACTKCHEACQQCTSYGPYMHLNGCMNAPGYQYQPATYMDPDTRITTSDMQSVPANTPDDAYNTAGCRQTEYLKNGTCTPCNMNLTCPEGQMPICGYQFNECRGGEGVKIIGRDGEAKQCYDQNAWPWTSTMATQRDAKFTQEFGPDWRNYQANNPPETFLSKTKGTSYEGWCDSTGKFVAGPSNPKGTGTRRTGTTSSSSSSSQPWYYGYDPYDDQLVQEYGFHTSCDTCFPCYPTIEPTEQPHCVCNWGFRDVDNSTADGDTVTCVAGTSDDYVPYTKIFQNGQKASFTIQPCEGSGCNAAGIKISLIALRELRADGTVIYDVQYPNFNDQLERHDDDGNIYVEPATTIKYRGKSSAVPNRFGLNSTGDSDPGTSDGSPRNYCQCRHTMEYSDLDNIDFRVNDVNYESIESATSGTGRISYIDWQVSPNGFRGFDARIASFIIDQDELDYSFGFFGQAPENTTYFFSPATSFAFSTVVFDEEAAFCLDSNEILGCNDYISATPGDVQGCTVLGAACGGSYAWYIDYNFSEIIASGEVYNATDKVFNNVGLVYWGPAENFEPSSTGANYDQCDHRLDQRNPANWDQPEVALVNYVTSCWNYGSTNNITLNQQSQCTSNLGRKAVAAICLYVPGTEGWCGCMRETHVMKRGSFKFAIEAHNYTYSVNGDSFEVEFTIEPVTQPPQGVFYPQYVLPSWGGLVNGVDPTQSFYATDSDGNIVVVPAANFTELIPLNPQQTARYNHWNPDNSTAGDGAPTYNYTDYPDGDFRLGSSGTLRLSRFYSDDNTAHWQTFPPGYTFAGYADPTCSGNVVLTVRIRFPRPRMTAGTNASEPIDYIWDPVMHFGSDASIPSNKPVFDPKAPPYNGRAYLGQKYAADRSVTAQKASLLSTGAIIGIVVAGAVVAVSVVVMVVACKLRRPRQPNLKQAPAISAPTSTNDLIHI